MGFQPQLTSIFALLPSIGDRQVLLFTATWPKSVRKIAAAYLASEHVHMLIGKHSAGEPGANSDVKQEFHLLDDTEKDNALLREVYKMEDTAKVVIFTNTKRRAD